MRELTTEFAIDMANHGIGVVGSKATNQKGIFIGEMPDEVNEGFLVVNVPSPQPQQYVDTEYTVIDIWSRSPHTDRGMQMLREVYGLYHRRYNWTTNNWHIYFSQALGSIVDMDRDINSGKLFRLSIQFISRNLNNIS